MSDDKHPHVSSSAEHGSDPEEPTAVHDPAGTPEPEAPMKKPRGDDGYGLLYRFFFRFQYTLLHIIGPPRLTASMDPRTQLKREHERRKGLHQQWKAAKAKV